MIIVFRKTPGRERMTVDAWSAHGGYHEGVVEVLRSVPGAKWNGDRRCWTFPDNALEVLHGRFTKLDDVGVRVDPGYEQEGMHATALIPRLPGHDVKLDEWQWRGIGRGHANDVLLAWGMGAGKTRAALSVGWLSGPTEQHPFVVVCPAHVVSVWRREALKWDLFDGSAADDPRFVVVSYEGMSKLSSALAPRVLVFDEAHYLCNASAQRSKRGAVLRANAERTLLLTGTPMGNTPANLHALVTLLHGEILGPMKGDRGFGVRHCGAYLEELPEQAMDAIRRKYEQSGSTKRVPTKAWKYPLLADVPYGTDLHLDELALRIARIADVVTEGELNKHLPPYSLTRTTVRLQGAKLRHAQYLQERIAEKDLHARGEFYELAWNAKRKAVLDEVRLAVERDDRPAVLLWRKECAAQMMRILEGFGLEPVLLTGDVSQKKRDGILQALEEGAPLLPVCTIDAIQTGISMTACNAPIFGELVPQPYAMAQAFKRFHRRGQVNEVQGRVVCVEESLDERMAAILEAKIAALSAVIGKGTEESIAAALRDERSEDDVLADLFGRI